ncbi:MAG: hypothetical protein ACREID_02340 [Planctomycetota bacterium]
MESGDRRRVTDAIESHTQRVPIESLYGKGATHVRVISGTKALELIEAIVDDVITRRAGQLADGERDRVVKEANEQFQRVSRIQAEAEALANQQSALIAGQTARIKELESKLKRAAASLQSRERRLANASLTIESYDREIVRLAAQVQADAALLEELRGALQERAAEVRRLRDAEGPGLEVLRAELAALRDLIVGTRAREAGDLEGRFEASLQRTLDSVSKSLRAATAPPIDRPVEATEALVARVFDRSDEMDSNLSRLDVEVTATREGIAESLARLRRLRDTGLDGEETPEAPSAPA